MPDSRPETHEHIRLVQGMLLDVAVDLLHRARDHDASKLMAPELEVFDRVSGQLRDLTYGSAEYRAALEEMGPALEHHYAANDHHPEHFEHGIAEMNLLQVIEMLADWKAASWRHADGDLLRSIKVNSERFLYGPELRQLLLNTARDMGWLVRPPCPLCAAGHAPKEPCDG